MKASEIRNLSVQELNEKLSDLKSELFNLRFHASWRCQEGHRPCKDHHPGERAR